MRLLRFGPSGAEKPGVLDRQGFIRDLSAHVSDIDHACVSSEGLKHIAMLDLSLLPEVPSNIRLGPPVANIRKCVCTGPNYFKMSEEAGAPVPSEPRLYMKADTAIVGPTDDIRLPEWATTAHWEAEIGVVIGQDAFDVRETDIDQYIAGYCIVDDIVDHEAQTIGYGESVKGRSAPGFGPVGPYLVTKDEIPDVQSLGIWAEVDGRRFTNGNSADMIFKIPQLVSCISRYMLLRPGDLVSSGTPGGVGRKPPPPVVLRPGQVIRIGIDGLGEQCSRIIQ